MSMEVIATGEPVIGILPNESFIPATELVVAEVIDDIANISDLAGHADTQTDDFAPANRIPRFTFRVVGESFENRQLDLDRLVLGDAVYLIREPSNPYDSNAVAVVNRERRVLGYLKREVSLWFAPILDKGRKFQSEVKQRTASGGILSAVFDLVSLFEATIKGARHF